MALSGYAIAKHIQPFQFSFILRIERSVLKIDEQELLKRLKKIEKWGDERV
jgi:hypothetical protein